MEELSLPHEQTILMTVRALLEGGSVARQLIERELKFQSLADTYWPLLKANTFDSDEAESILCAMETLDHGHPLLLRFDLEARRRRACIARGQAV